jgi:hypothetical protein
LTYCKTASAVPTKTKFSSAAMAFKIFDPFSPDSFIW